MADTTKESDEGQQVHAEECYEDYECIEFKETEVDYVVNSLKSHISPGPDKIKTPFIQMLYRMHKKFFLKVFNAALKLRHFPTAWKVSRVVLIPKKTSHGQQNIEDFRPIAINSIFAKIFEKLIYTGPIII